MSGITTKMLPTDDKRFIVSNVRKNSAAEEAGIMVNDEFLEINKIPIDFWELSDLIKLFRSEEGRPVSVKMKRYNSQDPEDFEIFESRFQLKRQI
jgi:C-terminal processing protease CtpA/Prc